MALNPRLQQPNLKIYMIDSVEPIMSSFYITDGKGWDSDKSHLMEAMKYIGKVF